MLNGVWPAELEQFINNFETVRSDNPVVDEDFYHPSLETSFMYSFTSLFPIC